MSARQDGWIGLRVARWRDVAGMTQQQLADGVGVTREYISMIENGRRAITKRSLLIGLANTLGVAVTDLTALPLEPRTPDDHAIHGAVAAVRVALDGDPDMVAAVADELEGKRSGVLVPSPAERAKVATPRRTFTVPPANG